MVPNIFLTASIAAIIALSLADATPIEDTKQLRLPTDLLPVEYVIELVPLLQPSKWTALGRVWINLNCSVPTTNVIFHTKDITIDQSSVSFVSYNGSNKYNILTQDYDEGAEMHKMVLNKPLEVGKQYRLFMKYTAVLSDLLQGFYRSSYIDSATNETRWLAATQFSPTDARRAFPCWDEPAFKARFTISLGRPSNMTSLSNMPIAHISQLDKFPGWYWDHYKTTLPMSTYLVGFIVSDLAHFDAVSNKPYFSFKVWSRKEALPQAVYAANIGPRLLENLEKYFNIDFPLPKLDLVALPDFGFNGMENWGLITFRESAMLYDQNVSTIEGKKKVGIVVGHEIAHQWFGNLVTPQWWNDLWLKEGFATYIGYKALNSAEPSWSVMDQFVVDTLQPVMSTDSLKTSHQISNPVADPKDIRQIFDVISYDKGASVIRMISSFLGEDMFRKGLQIYLLKHKYENAVRSQLWDAFSQADQKLTVDIGEVMDSWTLQTGYPVLTVSRNYSGNKVSLKQERFLQSGEKIGNSSWWIPVSYTTEIENNFETTIPKLWMHEKQVSISLPHLPPSKWLLVNINQTGYFRVNYDLENWALLNHSFLSLPQLTQAQLIDDAYNLAAAGYIEYTIPLALSEQLKNNNNCLPWRVSMSRYRDIINLLSGNLEVIMMNYIISVLPKQNLTLYSNELPSDYLSKSHSVNILKGKCRFGQQQCVNDAKSILKKWMLSDNIEILADLKPLVYCTGVRYGGQAEWDFVWNNYLSSNVGSDRESLLSALSCSRNTKILNKYLTFILNENSMVRKQDGGLIFAAVASNKVGAGLAVNYLSLNWKALQNHFGLAFNRISKMIESLSGCLSTETQLNQLQKLYEDNKSDLGTTKLSLLKTIENVQLNINWLKSNSHQIEEWLKKYKAKES